MKTITIIFTGIFLLSAPFAMAQTAGYPSIAGPDSVITWKFNSQGDSSLNVRMTYRYDSHFRTVFSERSTRETALNIWVPNRKDIREYDNQDRVTIWAIYEWNTTSSSYRGFMKEHYIFDDQENTTEYNYYVWDDNLWDWHAAYRDVFYCDNQEKLTRADYFDWNWNSGAWDTASYEIYDYGENGLLRYMTEYQDVDGTGVLIPYKRSDYTYDAAENITGITKQIYGSNTQLWYFTEKHQYWYDSFNRKLGWKYAEYNEAGDIWIEKEKEDWGWDENDSLTLYAYYRIGEDTVTWYPSLKSEMIYNDAGKITLYRGFAGDENAQWVPTYERRYAYRNNTLLISDSLFQWIADDLAWTAVDFHEYSYDSADRKHTDSYYSWVVHTHQMELSTRALCYYGGPASLDEHGKNRLVAYPNPTHGKLLITAPLRHGDTIELVDLRGSILKTVKQVPGNIETPELDISSFPAGVYFIRIYADKQLIVKKIVKH